MAKQRLDQYLVDHNMVESRSMAQSMIMAGEVYINGQKAAKAGESVTGEEKIEVRGKRLQYVSRGGLKLDKAMKVFPIDLSEKVCMDIGASTGGFTDCMLQNGAVKVYSVDVGYGQLAWKLRTDERVVNLERTNFRYVTEKEIPDKINFSSVDVSFISLSHILPVLNKLLVDDGEAVCLIKPQFEAGKEKVGKKGVVRDLNVHLEVVEKVIGLALDNGFDVLGLQFSPIKGPEGNIEYLIYLKKSDNPTVSDSVNAKELVNMSHDELDKR